MIHLSVKEMKLSAASFFMQNNLKKAIDPTLCLSLRVLNRKNGKKTKEVIMAILQMSYLSKALFHEVPVTVILPTDALEIEDMYFEQTHYRAEPGQRFKTLYLLHSMAGNHTDWVSHTRIQRWAEENQLAVVMPACGNSYYVNAPEGRPNNNYGDYIGQELVEMTRNMFPLSDKKEDTFIGGSSMGGFGAILAALRYPDTFSRVIGISSAMHILEETGKDPIRDAAFGDRDAAWETDRNPRVALDNLLAAGKELPKFYMTCGTEDFLLQYSRIFKDLLEEKGADVTYVEAEGAHEWDFWDRAIKGAIDWLPLQDEGGSLAEHLGDR